MRYDFERKGFVLANSDGGRKRKGFKKPLTQEEKELVKEFKEYIDFYKKEGLEDFLDAVDFDLE